MKVLDPLRQHIHNPKHIKLTFMIIIDNNINSPLKTKLKHKGSKPSLIVKTIEIFLQTNTVLVMDLFVGDYFWQQIRFTSTVVFDHLDHIVGLVLFAICSVNHVWRV